MRKRMLALGAVWLGAVLASSIPGVAPGAGPAGPQPAASRVGQAVVGGLVVALSPVGVLVGCGGGGGTGPSRTSATAVALPD